jgi:uracil-DNA glycosylase
MKPILNKKKYSKSIDWKKYFKNNDLFNIPYDPSWTILFSKLHANEKFTKLNKKLKKITKENKNIYPKPEYVFNTFMITRASEVKVVFIGQDPYFNTENYKNKQVPQAMGLSFSVPNDFEIPSSLKNIYRNLIKYKHIKKEQKDNGNLWFWGYQGCLMLNATLTIENGIKKSHTHLWEWFTNKHHTIISSHPSGLSANKPFRNYPPFMEQDHFGKINTILENSGKQKIIW